MQLLSMCDNSIGFFSVVLIVTVKAYVLRPTSWSARISTPAIRRLTKTAAADKRILKHKQKPLNKAD